MLGNKMMLALCALSLLGGVQPLHAAQKLTKKVPAIQAAPTLKQFVLKGQGADGNNDVDVTCTHGDSNPHGCDEFLRICAKYGGEVTEIPPYSYHCHVSLPSDGANKNGFKATD